MATSNASGTTNIGSGTTNIGSGTTNIGSGTQQVKPPPPPPTPPSQTFGEGCEQRRKNRNKTPEQLLEEQ